MIGHTTKGNPRIAVQPTDYFGSSMLQNFFFELSFLDTTRDGNFFLCHSKTKREECYNQTVPVLTRGPHRTVGVGFTFEAMRSVADIQLPFSLVSSGEIRKRNLAQFKHEIAILDQAGVKRSRIAELCNVNRSAITHLFED